MFLSWVHRICLREEFCRSALVCLFAFVRGFGRMFLNCPDIHRFPRMLTRRLLDAPSAAWISPTAREYMRNVCGFTGKIYLKVYGRNKKGESWETLHLLDCNDFPQDPSVSFCNPSYYFFSVAASKRTFNVIFYRSNCRDSNTVTMKFMYVFITIISSIEVAGERGGERESHNLNYKIGINQNKFVIFIA